MRLAVVVRGRIHTYIQFFAISGQALTHLIKYWLCNQYAAFLFSLLLILKQQPKTIINEPSSHAKMTSKDFTMTVIF
jgi:hypothetical protein